jgi:hypothetical protein
MLKFDSQQQAEFWMINEALDGEENIDNVRFAYLDDEQSQLIYEESIKSGCCGQFDTEVEISGRRAKIGCNYGH